MSLFQHLSSVGLVVILVCNYSLPDNLMMIKSGTITAVHVYVYAGTILLNVSLCIIIISLHFFIVCKVSGLVE